MSRNSAAITFTVIAIVKFSNRSIHNHFNVDKGTCVDSKIYQYFRPYIHKISHQRFPIIITVYFFRYAHPKYMKCLFTNIEKQYNMLKSSLVFNRLLNNSRILRLKNTKFSGCCLCMKPSI